MTIALLTLAGFVFLIGGAEILVRGASGLAQSFRLSKVVVGLTVVSFGTSAPEFAVSLQSGFAGQPDILMGNVIGSNIANVLLILGLTSIFVPLIVHESLIRLDVPIMVGLSGLLYVLALDGQLIRLESALLAGLLVAYLGLLFWMNKKGSGASVDLSQAAEQDQPTPIWKDLLYITLGLVGLVLGARWLVAGAVDVAEYFGVSELIIGITIVAIGTSLPELATSIVAATKGEKDIAVGNVVGSNIMNILVVLGVSGAILPVDIPIQVSSIQIDLPFMLIVAVCCFPVMVGGFTIHRWEGALLFAWFVAFMVYSVLSVKSPEIAAMMEFWTYRVAGPLTLLAIFGGGFANYWMDRKKSLPA